jgi:AmiR/NasT family two-component response regulator
VLLWLLPGFLLGLIAGAIVGMAIERARNFRMLQVAVDEIAEERGLTRKVQEAKEALETLTKPRRRGRRAKRLRLMTADGDEKQESSNP